MLTELPLSANRCQLAIIDLQTKAAQAMQGADIALVVQNASSLLQAAQQMNVPTLVTEHYPVDLGNTVPELAQYFGTIKPIAKTTTSAYKESKFRAGLQKGKTQIVLVGLEAHAGVYELAKTLLRRGWQVYVVNDAVISRNNSNKQDAIQRLVYQDCISISTQAVLKAWAKSAAVDQPNTDTLIED